MIVPYVLNPEGVPPCSPNIEFSTFPGAPPKRAHHGYNAISIGNNSHIHTETILMYRIILPLLIAVTIIGCGTPRMMTQPDYQARPTLEKSLFKGDADLLSEDDIQRILNSRVALPTKVKVAMMKFDQAQEDLHASRYYGYYYWRSEDYLKLQQQYIDTIQSQLLGSGRVGEATVMPTLLLPKEPTVTALRQASVRMQADLLLVYRITGDVYYDYVLFGKDDVKAFSTCELVLLDIRTGTIPFTTVATREVLSQKAGTDLNQEDAMKRVQKDASLAALMAVSQELAGFFRAVP
jgi:hypothetical protein